MSEELLARDSSSISKPAVESAFFKVFAAGVIGWVVATVILFGLSWVLYKPVSISGAVVWTISHNWAGFLFGALVLLGYGLKSGACVARAGLAYMLPVGILAGLGWVCWMIYPDRSLREELFTYLPMVLMFYGVALLWIWMRRGSGSSDYFARAVIPSLLGGAVILGFVTVPVFGSDAFRYRNTFQLKVAKAGMENGKYVADVTLEIREPGNFEFSAPRYVFAMEDENAEMELGAMTWGAAGEPKAGAVGVFPLRIIWSKALMGSEDLGLGYDEGAINLEVRDANDGNRTVYFLDSMAPSP